MQIFSQQRRVARGQIGCTAHLRKLHREDNGIWPSTLKVIAEGDKHLESSPSEGIVFRASKASAGGLHEFGLWGFNANTVRSQKGAPCQIQ